MTPKPKKPVGHPPHVPTDDDRKKVRTMAAMGVSNANICVVFGLSTKTLTKYYKRELQTGLIEANAKVAQSLFSMATSGEPKAVAAAIFWLKCRAGWKEPEALPDTPDAPVALSVTFTRAVAPADA